MCAEMAAELEPCHSMIWHAAHCYDHDPSQARLMACHTKAHVSEVGQTNFQDLNGSSWRYGFY